MLGAVAVDGWISHRDAGNTASVMQDRLLLGSARIVAEQLHVEEGAFQDRVPPAALELFESAEIDRVYYRVTTGAGQIVTGYPELALPGGPLQPETPVYFDTLVRGAPVRAVAYLQPVLAEPAVRPVIVEIGQTMNGHAALTRRLWLHTMSQQLLLLALVAALVLFGLRQGLMPLLRLRDTVAAREPGSLQPLSFEAMPMELSPLVHAINEYARRLDQYMGAQRVFIQNAAHQLRTTANVECHTPVIGPPIAWMMGGLHHQIDHHLAPALPHTSYAAMGDQVRRLCVANDVEYRVHPSLWAALRSHTRWLKAMGRPTTADR